MRDNEPPRYGPDRRSLLQMGAVGLSGLAALGLGDEASASERGERKNRKPTRFQIACMTLAYSGFPLMRALQGLSRAGYRYVAWGTSHTEKKGKRTPILAPEAPPKRAAELAKRCRALKMTPVMMFSTVSPDAKNAVKLLTNRIRQAAAAGIPDVLTFGGTRGGSRKRYIDNLRKLGPIARANNVTIVVKQHGGLGATGRATAALVRAVKDTGIRVNYDSGNVLDYNSKLTPADIYKDFATCADLTHSMCIKDHRNWPRDQDCGPGFGEIDHYRLLNTIAFSGRTIPICCENIFAPLVPRPARAEEIDALARRAREYLEVVIRGLQRQK